MIKVSYIVPFYNGQNTICQCLDSVLAIDIPRNEYEIIIVDDCSPTAAVPVLENYLQKYQNIKIVRHNVNKRQGGVKIQGYQLQKDSILHLQTRTM